MNITTEEFPIVVSDVDDTRPLEQRYELPPIAQRFLKLWRAGKFNGEDYYTREEAELCALEVIEAHNESAEEGVRLFCPKSWRTEQCIFASHLPNKEFLSELTFVKAEKVKHHAHGVYITKS